MKWNWQQSEWPNFRYDVDAIAPAEREFLRQGGALIGAFRHLRDQDEREVTAELLTSEALTTSSIEGEVLDRRSVRASIVRNLGFDSSNHGVNPREQGVAEVTTDVFRGWNDALAHERLFQWHRMLIQGRSDLRDVGRYRTHPEPMVIESGPEGRRQVHFVAPPSIEVPEQMGSFIGWFNASRDNVPSIARAGIAHLAFESIHPFEDGNGRIGRAISEVALAQGLGQPSLTLLATEIEARLNDYYKALELGSSNMDATEWLVWFADAVLHAQRRTQSWIDFVIAKTRILDMVRGLINARQESALIRMFQEGPSGFKGGLSSGNYQGITGAPPATTTRDLADLVDRGVLRRTGEGKGTRYWIAF